MTENLQVCVCNFKNLQLIQDGPHVNATTKPHKGRSCISNKKLNLFWDNTTFYSAVWSRHKLIHYSSSQKYLLYNTTGALGSLFSVLAYGDSTTAELQAHSKDTEDSFPFSFLKIPAYRNDFFFLNERFITLNMIYDLSWASIYQLKYTRIFTYMPNIYITGPANWQSSA